MIDQDNRKRIREGHLSFAEERGEDKTYCPSEVARKLFPENWRDKMDAVRKIADNMVQDGKLHVLQKGVIQTDLPSELKGPIRLQLRDEEE